MYMRMKCFFDNRIWWNNVIDSRKFIHIGHLLLVARQIVRISLV